MPHREKNTSPQDEEQGAPEWMVTFSDCMTLLLTFFVLLLTFSSFDERVFRKLNSIYCDAFTNIYFRKTASKEASIDFKQKTFEIEKGSEKPTLENGVEGALIKTDVPDFKKHRTFAIASQEIFWGKGSTISINGHKTLATVANFLRKVPGQIIISENGHDKTDQSRKLGLARSWQIMQFMITQEGLGKERFNISTDTTVRNKAFDILNLDDTKSHKNRFLEIVLLDKSICN
ncbi:MAG: flagellar motor protein MotB [Phycisphaerales bacterium]|jgi:hypothetical protein